MRGRGPVSFLRPYPYARKRHMVPERMPAARRIKVYTDAFSNGTLGLFTARQWLARQHHMREAQPLRVLRSCSKSGCAPANYSGLKFVPPAGQPPLLLEWDQARFIEWMVPTRSYEWLALQEKSWKCFLTVPSETLLAHLLMLEHSLEKGLARPIGEMRPLFGMNQVQGLMQAFDGAGGSFVVTRGHTGSGLVDGILLRYFQVHRLLKARGALLKGTASWRMPAFVERHLKSKALIGPQKMARNYEAGTVVAHKTDLLDATGSAKRDLAPFFESRHSIRRFSGEREASTPGSSW